MLRAITGVLALTVALPLAAQTPLPATDVTAADFEATLGELIAR